MDQRRRSHGARGQQGNWACTDRWQPELGTAPEEQARLYRASGLKVNEHNSIAIRVGLAGALLLLAAIAATSLARMNRFAHGNDFTAR